MAIYCGVDFHARQQTIAWCDTRDGEIHFADLAHHVRESVREFYSQFTDRVIVGFEASGYSAWFEEMITELGHEVWIGEAAEIRRRARSRQKTDRRDAELLLDLLLKDEFPRVHRPTLESREILRQLRYRQRLVRLRTAVINSLHAISLSAGVSLKAKLLTKAGRKRLLELRLSLAHEQQRTEWLELIDQLNKRIERIEKQIEEIAKADPRVQRVRTHPGLGLLNGLALVHTLWPVERFRNRRQVAAYIGLEPREYSSGEKQRFGRISKAGSRLLRHLLVEAVLTAVSPKNGDENLRRLYFRLTHRRDKARAKVAVARHLLIHAWIMLRDEINYAEFHRRGVEVRSARKVQRPEVPGDLIGRPTSGC